jgi:hypothetical protein
MLDLGLKGAPSREVQGVIGSSEYDVVVLDVQILNHEGAPPGYALDTQRRYAAKFVEAARHAQSRVILYMLWPLNPELGGIETTGTFEDVARWVGEMGEELGVAVAPVALAWRNALQQRPDLRLYADTEHPTIHGTYLGVCVVYATVLGKSPEGLDYWPQEDGVTEDDAAFLQQIAWETVREYEEEP